MGFFEAFMRALITIAFFVLIYYVGVWALGALGIIIPAMILKVFMVIMALIAILILGRLFYPLFNSGPWWPNRGP